MGDSYFWQQYLAVYTQPSLTPQNFSACEQAFIEHKQNIAAMIQALSPGQVAILGAGYLNDIPVADLLAAGRTVYLVDWQEQAPMIGISRLLLQQDAEDAAYHCLFCDMQSGRDYCANFSAEHLSEGVCSAFSLCQKPFPSCDSYVPATEPRFIKADITGGVARSFAANIEALLLFCETPQEAFLRTSSCLGNYHYRPLPIDSDSIELVTSSMVLSQFDFEPYSYFAALLEDRFGREELEVQEAQLRPFMENLRSRLFALQVDAHAREMHRIVKKDGRARVYLSSELFRSYPNSEHCFVVKDIPGALEIIGKYFLFAFDAEHDGKVLSKSALGNGVSINQCYRLVPRARPDSTDSSTYA